MKKRVLFAILFFTLAFTATAEVTTYKFNNMFTISVSDILELRKNDDMYTHYLKDVLNYDTKSAIVFQQRGLSRNNPSALSQYCRIMIVADNDESYRYPYSDECDFADNDIREMISACSNELAPGQCFISRPTAVVRSTSNGLRYIEISYKRSGNKGAVKVSICYFFNCKCAVKAIFSYRMSESDIWALPIRQSMDSFLWTHVYQPRNNINGKR